ncbi:unnamed protein product, partial [Laminaria digitata]
MAFFCADAVTDYVFRFVFSRKKGISFGVYAINSCLFGGRMAVGAVDGGMANVVHVCEMTWTPPPPALSKRFRPVAPTLRYGVAIEFYCCSAHAHMPFSACGEELARRTDH